MSEPKFTEADIAACWSVHANVYFAELLNGEATLEATRDDLRSLIGSKYDPRSELDPDRLREDRNDLARERP